MTFIFDTKIIPSLCLWTLALLQIPTLVAAEETSTTEETEQSTPETAQQPAPSIIERPTHTTPAAHSTRDLQQVPPDNATELIQLDGGDDPFVGFFRQQSGAVNLGGIILIADDQTHPLQNANLEALRKGLTEFGWATLSIPLPSPIQPLLPKRTLPALKPIKAHTPKPESPEQETETAATAPPSEPTDATVVETTPATNAPEETSEASVHTSDRKERITNRGMAAINALQSRQISRFIILGSGSGGVWATALATTLQENLDINLVLVDPTPSTDISAPDIRSLIPDLEITTLDLYSAAPSAEVGKSTPHRLRLMTARRKNLGNYHQIRLPNTTQSPQGYNWLLRTVRGLLETYIINAEPSPKLKKPKAEPEKANQPPGSFANTG
ncbi:DUF3530 family protein [Neptunomonas concharum]|uniref:DUF3530 family protein n=1 Tax=Neptunomonas concharum TaxID=1031538 RepID=A0A5P1R9D0_9GAMM|nr:DUF3530 family protein [Neptunomonas concharum]QEQ95902.1 DUF3530 family protein [Neptunomonas concharum]